MARAISCVFLVFLYDRLALGGRTEQFSSKGMSSLVQSSKDGICNSRVSIYGYICEEHTVTTQDGHILGMQRIPMGQSRQKGNMPPVLLQHGLFMDGVTWLLNAPDESLAYILADNGFDVWIANVRGTKSSRGHTSLTPSDPAFWEWSWDELVAYDLPAFVQYVYNETGQKLHYVGHSLGTLMALASLSEQKLLDMLRSAALLSPIAYLSHITSPLARIVVLLAEVLYSTGLAELNPRLPIVTQVVEFSCQTQLVKCYDLLSELTGRNCCLNTTNINVFLANEPQSTSTKNVVHLAQMIRTGNIARFDYGQDNMRHYGQITPVYNMDQIPKDFPLYLSYGGQDALSDVADVNLLLDNLKDHDQDKLVAQYCEDYAHMDFVMGVNAKQVVYDPLIAFFGPL